MYTADPSLLLAFVYFDLNHTGYILDKDCEEILHILGLQLTRSQVHFEIYKKLCLTIAVYKRLVKFYEILRKTSSVHLIKSFDFD